MPDVILFWNDVALETNRRDHSRTTGQPVQGGPTLSSRALAIIHLAMYEAYRLGAGRPFLRPEANPPIPATGATAQAAASGAAYTALAALYELQRPHFDSAAAKLADSLAEEGIAMYGPGYDFGAAVARAILRVRKDDPDAKAVGYVSSPDPYRHRLDPDNPMQGFHAPFYGARSRLFVTRQRFGLERPPQDNVEYREAYKQVRRLGIAPELIGTLLAEGPTPSRTPTQTLVGIYWGYDGAHELGTPPRMYNQIIRKVAAKQGNSEARNAELFMLVNVAMGDAGILAWEQKYCHDFWRPVVGIRENHESLGPIAATPGDDLTSDVDGEFGADPGWLPLGAPATNELLRVGPTQSISTYPANQMVQQRPKNFTPPFPAYPSGHATFGAAAFHVTRLFYKQGGTLANMDLGSDDLFDDMGFVSDEFNGISQDNRGTVRPRHLRGFEDGLWGMILENGLSRVYLGVHWIFDAFAPTEPGGTEPDFNRNVGGIPLGLRIAEDIFDSFNKGTEPLMSNAGLQEGDGLFGNCSTTAGETSKRLPRKAGDGQSKSSTKGSRRRSKR